MSVDVTVMGEVDEVFTCGELAATPVMCYLNFKKNLDL